MFRTEQIKKSIQIVLPKTKLAVLLLLFSFTGKAQDFKQDIQGTVFNMFTNMPLIGVNLTVTKDSITWGCTTDKNGYFILKNLPTGKYELKASYIGYKNYIETNLDLRSGKSLDLRIAMEETIQELDEVSVHTYKSKNRPKNNMALIGARSFTIEETNRYAGSYGDPARMAMNYAGVLPVRDNRNDIIIRGNSSTGLQWRIDGIEIPNPNHFGASGTTGGPLTIINTNLLSKSDFMTAAFPAEYGNAIAGVFDLNLRSGNINKREHWAQVGWNGFEIGAEGPFKKGGLSSYIISTRLGVTSAADMAGINLKDDIDYKDISFKFNFPTNNLGYWSLVGIGGDSRIVMDERDYDEEDRDFETWGEKLDNATSMGMLGLTNRQYFDKLKIETNISASGNTVDSEIDRFIYITDSAWLWAIENTKEVRYCGKTKLSYKAGARSYFTIGGEFSHYVLSYYDIQEIEGEYNTFTDTSNAQTSLASAYTEFKHSFSDNFEIYLGLHGQWFFFNQSKNLEPRFSVKYSPTEKIKLSYGIGLHSQIQPLVVYFVQTSENGSILYTNTSLGFTKSLHNVLSFEYMINSNLRFETEIYHQKLYDVPIQSTQPEYSLLNFGTEYYVDRKDYLVNEGTGENYGIEFTFEHYYYKNYFYLITASLFESNYTSTDNITRSTAYNGKYAVNALYGYELEFPQKNVAFVFGINLTYAGGSPYVPFDSESTVEEGYIIYDWENAYKYKRDDYVRASFRIGIKRNLKNFSMETAFDLQYRDDYTNVYLERIDVYTGEIIPTIEMGFHPMANMRINF